MKSRILQLISLLSLLGAIGCGGSGSNGGNPGAIVGLVFVTGLNAPMQYLAEPGRPDIALVLERSGVVRAVVNDVLQIAPVLDVSGEVITSGECGLLGMAFDPQFSTNGFFYLNYVSGSPTTTRVVRYTMNPDGVSASPGSALKIFSWNQEPLFNHKGGSLAFGSDGLLYLGLGDGGGTNDPNNFAQDPLQLLGKMLRIDPSADDFPADPDNNYHIPASNPFVGTVGVREEIWAFGMRNPFRWSFDGTSGALIIADVGQDVYEEINYEPNSAPGGRNYGWRLREGMHNTGNGGPAYSSPLTDPFIEVAQPLARSIIGGFIYRGTALPVSMRGRYIFGDFITDSLWSLTIDLAGNEALPKTLSDATDHTASIGFVLSGIVSISPDANGEPVIVELSAGRLVRLVPAP